MYILLKVAIFIYVTLRVTRWYLVKFLWGSVNKEDETDVTDKIIVVTGSNTGIGKSTVYELAKRNAVSLTNLYLRNRHKQQTSNEILDFAH